MEGVDTYNFSLMNLVEGSIESFKVLKYFLDAGLWNRERSLQLQKNSIRSLMTEGCGKN